MSTRIGEFQPQIIYQPGAHGGKPHALSRRPEYRSEKGAEYTQQSILKPEHFQVMLIQPGPAQGKAKAGIKTREVGRLRIRPLHLKAKMPTKGSRMAVRHDIYAIEEILIPA